MPSADATANAKCHLLVQMRHASGWSSPGNVSDYALTIGESREASVTTVQPGGGPTVRRMLVGAQLRRLRTDKGISREQAGEAIRASEWKIHRLENGQVGFKDRDIVDLLRFYGVDDPGEVADFLVLAREANAPGWWHHYGDVLPPWFRAYVDLESAAAVIRAYEGQFVPGTTAAARRRSG